MLVPPGTKFPGFHRANTTNSRLHPLARSTQFGLASLHHQSKLNSFDSSKPLRASVIMVELFTAAYFSNAAPDCHPERCVATPLLPTLALVNGPLPEGQELRTPTLFTVFSRSPCVFVSTERLETSFRECMCPSKVMGSNYEIVPGRETSRVYFVEPPSHRTSPSRGVSSGATEKKMQLVRLHLDCWLVRPVPRLFLLNVMMSLKPSSGSMTTTAPGRVLASSIHFPHWGQQKQFSFPPLGG